MTVDEGKLHIALNVGMFNADSPVLTRSSVEPLLREAEERFAARNHGDRLTLVLDQPQDARFIMERGSRHYRGPRLPESYFYSRKLDAPESRFFERISERASERGDYTIQLQSGQRFFLRSGLVRYAGGQVHYDLILLSDPVLRDFDSSEYCPSTKNGSKRDFSGGIAEGLSVLAGGAVEVYRSPGRNALDGLSVFTHVDRSSGPILEALSVLLEPRSPCFPTRPGEPELSPGRRAQLRVLAARNGDASSSLSVAADCETSGKAWEVPMLPIQLEMLHNNSEMTRREFCSQHFVEKRSQK